MMLRQIGFRRILPGLVAPNLEQRFFGAGQQGGVYLFDKAHQASAFQGSAYDTPLSAVEQYVGSFYDLSGNANHFTQPTSTARGKWSARVNMLTNSGFANTGGAAPTGYAPGIGTGVSVPAGIAGNGSVIYTQSATAQRPFFVQPVATVAGCTYSNSIIVTTVSGVRAIDVLGVSGISPAFTLNGVPISTIHLVTPGVLVATWTAIGTSSEARFGIGVTGGATGTLSFHSADTRPSNVAYLPYQAVVDAANYDTAGFPPYLIPDGADDYYTSASGGGSTTGIFLCAAIAPIAAGAKQVIWSDASGNTGYELCINSSNQVEFSAGTGSARVSCVSAALTLGAPKVITAQHDGTTLTVRVDGVATTAACGAASAGTAGTTLLRANGAASSYAKVQINGLVQRHGAQPSAELLAFAERYMATLQGRTL